jgi:hypothetical protein
VALFGNRVFVDAMKMTQCGGGSILQPVHLVFIGEEGNLHRDQCVKTDAETVMVCPQTKKH